MTESEPVNREKKRGMMHGSDQELTRSLSIQWILKIMCHLFPWRTYMAKAVYVSPFLISLLQSRKISQFNLLSTNSHPISKGKMSSTDGFPRGKRFG